MEPPSLRVPRDELTTSIATLRKNSPDATALLTDLTEARPFARTKLNVKTHDSGQLISGLVDCAATLAFVSEDFARRFSLPSLKSKAKTPVRLANGHRVTSSTTCEITFGLAKRESKRTLYVLSVYQCRHARFRSSCTRRAKARDVTLNFT
jgi:hypothetical protein